jgi:hypothetical protein
LLRVTDPIVALDFDMALAARARYDSFDRVREKTAEADDNSNGFAAILALMTEII